LDLLKDLLAVHAPSGEEFRMKSFLLEYIGAHAHEWETVPVVLQDETLFHDALVLVFGTPRTLIFAHTDSIGFTVRYQDQLVPIGSPKAETGYVLSGKDKLGPIECTLRMEDDLPFFDFPRAVQRGTSLVFRPNFRLSEEFIQSPYLDNRLGVFVALQVAQTLKDGAIVFSTFEEHGGGSVPFILDHLCRQYPIRQALIADITWVTDGVSHGEGVVISMRDRNIPRRKFIDKIVALADKSGIPYQLEVEGSGSSDGREVQLSHHPVDWCFIGAPEDHVHSPDEKVHLSDLQAMIDMYIFLMNEL